MDALGSDLVRWAQAQRDRPLAAQEPAVLERVRAALPAWLGAVLTRSTRHLEPGLRGLPQRCPTGDRRCPVQSWRPRRVTTSCGRVVGERPWYVCRGCRQGWSPVEHTGGVGPRGRLSAGLPPWLAELGAAPACAEGQEWRARRGGVPVAKETGRAHAEPQGPAREAAQQAARPQVERPRASAAPVAAAPGPRLVETAGVMRRTRETGWPAVPIGLVAGWVAGALGAPSDVAARAGAAAFGDRLRAEAARRGALAIVGWAGGRTGAGRAG